MKNNQGFTLIELLITIAIIGILAAVAFPSYQSSVKTSRRADAKAALTGFAQAMELYYMDKGTYQGAAESGDDTGSPTIFDTTAPLDSSDIYYNLTIDAAGASSYTLKATPDNAQSGDGILTLQGTGEKGWDADNNGTIGDTEKCWETSCS